MNLSEDGGRVAFLGVHNAIYRDGELYFDYGNRQVSFPLTLSGNGQVLAWKVQAEGGSQVVVNGQSETVYQDVGLPVTSFDGKTVAYRASQAPDRWFIVLNGRKVCTEFESLTQPALSRDGRVLAYAAQGESPVLIVGEKRIEIATMPTSVVLSRDGTRWACVTRTSVMTEEGHSEAFDEIREPEFSPDGSRIAFGARRGDRWMVVVNGRTHPAEGVVWGPLWSEDGRQIAYGALLGRELWWKVIPCD